MVLLTGQVSGSSTPAQISGLNGGDPNRPDIPSDAYHRMKPRWEMCRALMTGTEAIRAGEETYLPRLENETDASYEFRRDLVALHNGFQRTVLSGVGFILEEPPAFDKDMPQPLVDFAENVDRAGTHLNVFTQRLLNAGLTDGYAGIMVEYPKVSNPSGVSKDEEKRKGLSAYWLMYKVDDVMKLVYERINGVRTLTLLVLRETVKRRVKPFGWKLVTQYRVYTNEDGLGIIRAELWEATPVTSPTVSSATGTVQPPSSGAMPQKVLGSEVVIKNQTLIPWSPFLSGMEIGQDEWNPPLINLASLNIEHHQCKTNIRALETLACVPTQVRIGAMKDDEGKYPEVILGPRSTIEAPYQQGLAKPIYWHTPEIAVLEQAQKSQDKIEAAMGAAGMAFLSPDTRRAETAAARRIDSAAQRATLSTEAQALQDCLERAFEFTGNFMGEKAGSLTVNDNFTGENMDPQLLAVLLDAYTKDALTLEELRYVLQTGQLPEDFDASDTMELLAKALADKKIADAAAAKQPPIPGKKPPVPVAA